MKQKIITPPIKNCFCGKSAKIQTWEFGSYYDLCYQVVCEDGHAMSKYCGTPHRAICKWNNRVEQKIKEDEKDIFQGI